MTKHFHYCRWHGLDYICMSVLSSLLLLSSEQASDVSVTTLIRSQLSQLPLEREVFFVMNEATSLCIVSVLSSSKTSREENDAAKLTTAKILTCTFARRSFFQRERKFQSTLCRTSPLAYFFALSNNSYVYAVHRERAPFSFFPSFCLVTLDARPGIKSDSFLSISIFISNLCHNAFLGQ